MSLMTSAQELRNRLFERLRAAGTVDELKAQVRVRVIEYLRDRASGQEAELFPAARSPLESSTDALLQKVVRSLVVDFLETEDCQYTLSVYLPEGGLDSSQPLSREELLRILGLEEDRSQDGRKFPLLARMLKGDWAAGLQPQYDGSVEGGSGKQPVETMDSMTQTRGEEDEAFPGESAAAILNRKLQYVTSRYTALMARESMAPQKSVEERMIRYQRDCDERAHEHIKSELKRFREIELEAMRVQERGMVRRELATQRDNLQREYQARIRRLAERERELDEMLSRQQAEVEAALFEERQKLLQRFHSMDEKSRQDARELELERKLLKQTERDLETKKRELEHHLLQAKEEELKMKKQHDDEIANFRRNVIADFEHREKSLQTEERRLKHEAQDLERLRKQATEELSLARGSSEEASSLQERLGIALEERDKLLAEKHVWSEKFSFQEKAIENEKQRSEKLNEDILTLTKEAESLRLLTESSEAVMARKDKDKIIESLRKQLAETNEEMEAKLKTLREEKLNLEAHRDSRIRQLEEQLNRAKESFEQELADMRDIVFAANRDAEVYRSESESRNAALKNLEAENADLRNLLAQTRSALDNEIANPREEEYVQTQLQQQLIPPAPPPFAAVPHFYFAQQPMPLSGREENPPASVEELRRELRNLQQELASLQANNTKFASDGGNAPSKRETESFLRSFLSEAREDRERHQRSPSSSGSGRKSSPGEKRQPTQSSPRTPEPSTSHPLQIKVSSPPSPPRSPEEESYAKVVLEVAEDAKSPSAVVHELSEEDELRKIREQQERRRKLQVQQRKERERREKEVAARIQEEEDDRSQSDKKSLLSPGSVAADAAPTTEKVAEKDQVIEEYRHRVLQSMESERSQRSPISKLSPMSVGTEEEISLPDAEEDDGDPKTATSSEGWSGFS